MNIAPATRVTRVARAVFGTVALVLVAGIVGSCTGDDGGDGGGAGDAADFCAAMARFDLLQAEGDALFASTEEVSVDELRDVFRRVDTTIDELIDSAPESVSTDVRLVGDTTQRLIEALERVDYDLAALATDPQYAESLADVDDTRITEANDRLAVYVRTECPSSPTTEPAS